MLLDGQGGQAGFRDEDGEALGAAGIALDGCGLAGDPFAPEEGGQNRERSGGGGAEGGDLYGLTGGQAGEDAVIHVLLVGGEIAAAFGFWYGTGGVALRGADFEGAGEHIAAEVGDAVVDGAADFGHEGQHAAKDFAEGGEIVLGHPLGELEELVAEKGLVVEDGFEVADFKLGWLGEVGGGDHADEFLVVEGDDDACAALGMLVLLDGVGEHAVKGDGQRDFAANGHGGQASV